MSDVVKKRKRDTTLEAQRTKRSKIEVLVSVQPKLLENLKFFQPRQEQRDEWNRSERADDLKSYRKERSIALSNNKDKQAVWANLLSKKVCAPTPINTVASGGVVNSSNNSSEDEKRGSRKTSVTCDSETNSNTADQCWFYRNTKTKQYKCKGVIVVPHRVAWTLFHGLIPPKLDVRHTHGGYNGCFNPGHFKGVGTAKDNAHDKRDQGTLLRGEQIHGCKLTTKQVEQFILLLVSGAKTAEARKRSKIQMSRSNAHQIAIGRTWKHVWTALFKEGKISRDSVPDKIWSVDKDVTNNENEADSDKYNCENKDRSDEYDNENKDGGDEYDNQNKSGGDKYDNEKKNGGDEYNDENKNVGDEYDNENKESSIPSKTSNYDGNQIGLSSTKLDQFEKAIPAPPVIGGENVTLNVSGDVTSDEMTASLQMTSAPPSAGKTKTTTQSAHKIPATKTPTNNKRVGKAHHVRNGQARITFYRSKLTIEQAERVIVQLVVEGKSVKEVASDMMTSTK